MKRNRVIYLILIVAILPAWIIGGRVSGTALAANQDENAQPAVLAAVGGPIGQNAANWSLTFNDEFDGTSLNTSTWRQDYWNGGNGELQEYVNDNSHGNYNVANGVLSLTARKESYNGKSYTSGAITTQSRFAQTYGYFEMRAKLPSGRGMWPAFWLMPNPSGWPPEIDIMENLGGSTVYMTLHPTSGSQSQGTYSTDTASNYHVYGINWQPGYIAWSVDGVERYRVSDSSKIPNVPMFVLANLAVGGAWPGNPDSSTVFPGYFNIDYIRVWRYVSAPSPTATPTRPAATATPGPTRTPAPNPTLPPNPTAPPSSSLSLINDSSFEQTGASPWYSPWATRNDLGASFVQETRYATSGSKSFEAILPSGNSSQPWVVSLMQRNLSLVAGRTYTLSFWSGSNPVGSLTAIVQSQNSPYTEYFHKTITLTNNFAQYSYTFTAPTTTSAAMLNFNLASQSGKIWLDQVLLCEGTASCTPKN